MESNCISFLSLSLFLSSLYFFPPSFPPFLLFLSLDSSISLCLPLVPSLASHRLLVCLSWFAARATGVSQYSIATIYIPGTYGDRTCSFSPLLREALQSSLAFTFPLSLSLFLSSSCFLSLSSSVPRSSTAHTVHKKTPFVRKSGILFHSYNRYCHRREDLTSLTLHARAWGNIADIKYSQAARGCGNIADSFDGTTSNTCEYRT